MKDDGVFIRHILDELSYLKENAKGLDFEDFLEDETLKRAFARSIEIIGEASKNISEEMKEKHTGIEWNKITGMRNRLIHGYFGVNWKIVWDVIVNKLPELENQLQLVLSDNLK